jgi:hypothetical protein
MEVDDVLTSLLWRFMPPVWISLQARPMARRVRSHAINETAAAAERLSPRHTRTWLVPANTEAKPTMDAIRASGKKVGVILFPAPNE